MASVAYATEESASEAKTASAIVLDRRSCASWSVVSGRPTNRRFNSAIIHVSRQGTPLLALRQNIIVAGQFRLLLHGALQGCEQALAACRSVPPSVYTRRATAVGLLRRSIVKQSKETLKNTR